MSIKVKIGGSRNIRSVPKQSTNRPIITQGEKKPIIVPDSVVLGTDTIGNYIANISAGAGLDITPNYSSQTETANVVISHTDTSSFANTTNSSLGFVRNISVDQFGHIIGNENLTLNSTNFLSANAVISSAQITFGNTAITLGGSTNEFRGLSLVEIGDLTISTDTIASPGNIQLQPSVDGIIDATNHRITNVRDPIGAYDAVSVNYLGDTLEALELSLLIIQDPVKPTDATNKRYVDNVAQGLAVRPSALAGTTANLNGTFDSGNSTVTATITLPPQDLNIDGVTDFTLGSQILVKDQTNPVENGSYDIIQVGGLVANTEWILGRSQFNNDSVEIPGSFEYVTDGIVNKNKGFVATVQDAETFEINVNSISWVQFAGVGTFTAGQGLSILGTEFSVNEQQILDTITTPDNILTIVGTGGLTLPSGTLAERTQPAQGMLRFNTTDSRFEGYDGTAWAGLGGTIDTDQDTFVQAETASNADNDQLKFFVGGLQALIINSNKTIEANTSITINDDIKLGHSQVAEFNLTGAIQFPKGTTAERPAAQTGMIRYNTTDNRFEGFDNTGYWSSIAGSVIDLDRDTKIVAETNSGDDNDQIQFFTAGTLRNQIDANGQFQFGNGLNKFTIDFATGNTSIAGSLDVTGNVTIGGNITIGDADTDAITVTADFDSHLIPDATNTYDLGSNTKDWRTAYITELKNSADRITLTADIIDSNSTGGLIIPVGNVSERPTAEQGMIRYNTEDARFEAYNGIAWTGLGGVIDVDQNTYIVAESSPGADNNELDFYTAGTQRLQIQSNGQFAYGSGLSKFLIDYTTGDTNVNGKITVGEKIISANGNLILEPSSNTHAVSVNGFKLTGLADPTANTDAVSLGYLQTSFTSDLILEDGANTYNQVNLINDPTIILGQGLGVTYNSEDSANNEIGIEIKSTGVSAGQYGQDGFTPRITIDDTGRITFATDIPVELQANAIPDFTETVHDLVGQMVSLQGGAANNSFQSGISVTYDDPNDKLDFVITHNYVEDLNAGTGLTVSHTPATGSVANVAIDINFFDARYANITGDSFTNDISAPRFVDRDDTDFYADPAGQSRFNSLNVGFQQTAAQILMSGSQGTAYLYSDGNKLGMLNDTFNYAFYGRRDNGNFYVEGGDVEAERFVDTDNTTYFLHPAGTDSFLKQIEVETQLDVANLRFSSNQISSDNNIIDVDNARITNVVNPTSGQDAATKAYVDAVAQGLRVIPAALAATTADLGATYSLVNGTLTAQSNGAFSLDGVTSWSVGDRVLVKDQTNEDENGAYELTTVGDGSTPWVLTRGEYFNEASEIPGSFQFVTDGTVNRNTGYVATVADSETFAIGDDIIWYQFSGAGTYTGGDGLTLTGTDFSVNVDNVGIEIVADTLQLKDSGVTNAKLANPSFTIVDETSANTEITLGQSLTFQGTDGVDTTVTAGTVSIAVNEIDGGTF